MISQEPRLGDFIEFLPMGKDWQPFGQVYRVEGPLVWCTGKSAFNWCFGFNGCLGANVVFRIADTPAAITMDDPLFN